ncbi:MAG: pyrophosphate synthase [Gammaproteobacteria bacterium]|jgi:undecaprenyl diphosphate synthase|nr:pyrophosphate synthase [Gammaproteobacteria bacterium]
MSSNSSPNHIAIIMDGNGRWAERRGHPRAIGHEQGVKAIEKLLTAAIERKISVLTLFAFGVENWGRPQEEVTFLMTLFAQTIKDQAEHLLKHNIKLRVIGDLTPVDLDLQKRIREVEDLTANNTALTLVMAFNYSGRWDIVQATIKIAHEVAQGLLEPNDISDKFFAAYLSIADLPEPDLFIRTSGEQRISNFLLWQLAYTELYFTEVLWPDFDEMILDDALRAYSKRQRRYGLTSKQLQEN